MELRHKILTAVISSLVTAFLSLICLKLYFSLIPGGNLGIWDFTFLAYIIVSIFYAFLGIILAVILLYVNSFALSIFISLIFSVAATTPIVKETVDLYVRPDYFDKNLFFANLLFILANFILFPAICGLIWILKRKFLISTQI